MTKYLLLCGLVGLVLAMLPFERLSADGQTKDSFAQQTTNIDVSTSTGVTTLPRNNNAPKNNTNLGSSSNANGQAVLPQNDSDAFTSSNQMREEVEAKNVPIQFYAKVIDQDSNVLFGVEVSAWVRHWSMTSFGALHIERTTDSNGRFDIDGVTGDGISVETMSKSGYELEPGTLNFGPEGGTFFDPVVFMMWSTNSHQKLVTGSVNSRITPDGRSYIINLAQHRIAESGDGDLKVWINNTGNPASADSHDWSCEITALNGGLLEEPLGTAMYLAPTSSYVPSFQLQKQVNGKRRASSGARQFFINLNGGQEFGRITVELIAPFDNEVPGVIRLSYAINPSGSRILY